MSLSLTGYTVQASTIRIARWVCHQAERPYRNISCSALAQLLILSNPISLVRVSGTALTPLRSSTCFCAFGWLCMDLDLGIRESIACRFGPGESAFASPRMPLRTRNPTCVTFGIVLRLLAVRRSVRVQLGGFMSGVAY